MFTCIFKDGNKARLRHVVTHAIVEKEGKILLVKRSPHLLEEGKWGLPGGFLDINETATEGILRELKEETGWEGKIIKLFRINSSPHRPEENRQNVAFEFIVKPIRQTARPDGTESAKVEWISIEDILPAQQLAFDHADTIELFVKYQRNPFALPVIE